MTRYAFQIAGASILSGTSIHTCRRKLLYSADNLHDLRDAIVSDSGNTTVHYCLDNFRRGDDKTQSYILNALCAYRDAELDACAKTAALDFGREGCHEQNVRYYHDFLEHGRHHGQGHLFVGTLPTTPVCEVAIAMKLNGGIYYINAMNRFNVLWTEIEMQFECTAMQQVLVCNYTKERLLSFIAIPGEIDIPDDMSSPEDLFL